MSQNSATPTSMLDHVAAKPTQTGAIPGLVAMATTAAGPLYAGAFGQRGQNQPTPMTLDTLFWLASMTKAVTATAALQLVERNQLQLDTPASVILPALAEIQVLTGFDATGQPQLRPPRQPMTIHHLLTHTAGFGYDMFNTELSRYRKAVGKIDHPAGIPSALNLPLLFDPGEGWTYGINIDWIGRIIETITGERLGDYFRRAIFEPLAMHDTSFDLRPDQEARMATMYNRAEDGTLSVADFAMPAAPAVHGGGGGLNGTGPDFLRFLQMFLNRGTLAGRQILKAETIAVMAQNQIGKLTYQPIQGAKPGVANLANFYPGMEQKWGYSFLINMEETTEGRAAGSLAWAGLGNTYFWIDHTKGIAGLYLTQIMPFFDPHVITGFRNFEQAIYAQ